MSQIFHPSANTFSRLSIFGGVFVLAGALFYLSLVARSPYETGVGMPVEQPIPFSHQLHVGAEGLECLYCHASVEEAAFAGLPTADTCYNCHAVIQAQSPLLEPVRRAIRTGQPVVWNRVYDLPDFAYFDHSRHVTNGIGCETCHGRVDRMAEIWKAESLLMTWCLDCHRDPAQHVRPREAVYAMGYTPPVPQAELGPQLVAEYGLESLVSCSTCHR